MSRVFISYKRADKDKVFPLKEKIEVAIGEPCWIDLDGIESDAQFVNVIMQAIDDAEVFLFMYSKEHSCIKDYEKDWTVREINYAQDQGKRIVFVNTDKTPLTKWFKFMFGLKQQVDATSNEAFEYLLKDLHKWLKVNANPNPKKEEPHNQTDIESSKKAIAVFKFYSNENCQISLDGKIVGNIEGKSDEAYVFPVTRKGDYRFKIVNSYTAVEKVIKEHIDTEEEKDVDVQWGARKPLKPDQEWPTRPFIKGEEYIVDLGALNFNMIRVEGGLGKFGATVEQQKEADNNEFPPYKKQMHSFYISQFPITQNTWEIVMGYNKSEFRDKETSLSQSFAKVGLPIAGSVATGALISGGIGSWIGSVLASGERKAHERAQKQNQQIKVNTNEKGHYPSENLTYDEAQEFVRRLSLMTGLQFALPTEEEWEYAARGGNRSRGYKYAGSNNIDDVAWYRDNAEHSTHPVGEKKPNELGIYDMCGNVWEWTETPAGPYGTKIKTAGDVFIRRGGSWWHEDKNCRTSKRYASSRTKKTSGLGLRVVIRENIE